MLKYEGVYKNSVQKFENKTVSRLLHLKVVEMG